MVRYDDGVARVIQIRDVPEDVHDALADAARLQGLSLNKYVLRELDQVARRSARARHNIEVIRAVQAELGTTVGRSAIRDALDESRRH
jgi:hypothetical protein